MDDSLVSHYSTSVKLYMTVPLSYVLTINVACTVSPFLSLQRSYISFVPITYSLSSYMIYVAQLSGGRYIGCRISDLHWSLIKTAMICITDFRVDRDRF